MIYSINFFLVFSSKGPNILGISYKQVYDNSAAPSIADMSIKSYNSQFEDEIHWWFNEGIDKNLANQEWGCYSGCNLMVTEKNTNELFKINLTGNNCLNWAKIPLNYKEKINNIEAFCVQISCDDGKKSNVKCWKN